MSGLHRILNMPEYAWVCLPEHAWICLNIPGYAWICLNLPELFLFYIFPLSSLVYLNVWLVVPYFQRLHKTRCFSLTENKAVFLETQNLIFCIVAISILFGLCLRLSVFTSKISNLLLTFGAVACGGCKSWYTLF